MSSLSNRPRVDYISEADRAEIVRQHYRRVLAKRVRRVARVAIVATKNDITARQRRMLHHKRQLQAGLISLQQNKYRIVAASFVAILTFSTILPVFIEANKNKPLLLDAQTKALLGDSRDDTKDYLKYDANKGLYSFAAPAQDTSAVHSHTGRNVDAYTADVPDKASQGITVTEKTTDIAVTLTPNFFTGDARKSDGDHLVYQSGARRLIYTLKYNGLKEDIVVPKYQGPTLKYDFKLQLPSGVEARLDGQGNIGIYSSDPSLFGNISYGSDADRTKVDKARENGQKNNLVMTIPYPVIKDSAGNEYDNKASFTLGPKQTDTKKQKDTKLPADAPASTVTTNTYMLTVTAKNIQDLVYPISLDPTMQVASAADFSKMNLDSNATVDTTNSLIKRNGLSGGVIVPKTGGTFDTNGRDGHGVVAYNGFIYVIGGTDSSGQLSTVRYAPINSSDGSIGTWGGTTSLSTPTSSGCAVAYGGYIYNIGGVDGSNNGMNTFEYIKINSDGSLPAAWTTSAKTLPDSYRYSDSCVAYNNYLYAFGGYVGTNTSSTVYAPINADGNTGTWAYGPNMTVTRNGSGATVYNGYVYVAGGQSHTGLGTVATADLLSSVEYAKIGSNGVLSAFKTTTNMHVVRYAPVVSAQNGHIYFSTGCYAASSGVCQSYDQTTDYAEIYPDGSIGQVKINGTIFVSPTRTVARGVAYNGRLYVVGGCGNFTFTTGLCTSFMNDYDWASISAAGEISTFTNTSNSYTTGRVWYGTIAYNGFLYVLGGSTSDGTCSTGSGTLSDVQYATINSDGNIGSFSTTSAFVASELGAAGRCGFGLGIYNGFMYVIGGGSNTLSGVGSIQHTDVLYAQINSDGTLGSWTASSNKFTTARTQNGGVVYNGYVYVIGGFDGTSTYYSDIQYAPINTDGSVGTFAATTSFPTARAFLSTIAYDNKLYIYGGWNGGGVNDMRYIAINNDGTLGNGTIGSWHALGSSPDWNDLGLGFYNGEMYVYGQTTVYRATVASDGSLGSWTQMVNTSAYSYRSNYLGTMYKGTLYRTGGCTSFNGTTCSAFTTTPQYSFINNGGNGFLSGWSTSTNSLTTARSRFSTATYNGYIYVIGGITNSGATSEIIYASIDSSGNVGSWASSTSNSTSLPFTRSNHTGALYNGYVYVFEGNTSDTSRTRYAKLLPTGGLATDAGCGSAWCAAAASSTTRTDHAGAAWNGYVYLSGGCTSSYCTNTDYAQLLPTGGIAGDSGCGNAWCGTTALTRGRSVHRMIAFNGFLYVVGGFTTVAQPNFINTVEYAPINSNGTLGAWVSTMSLPRQVRGPDLAVINGFLYVIAGQYGTIGSGTAGTGSSTTTMLAPILGSGGVGNWQVATKNLAQSRTWLSVAATSNYLVALGGDNAGSTPTTTNSVEVTSVQSIPRVAQVSKQYDFDVGVKPTKLITRGTKLGGAVIGAAYTSSNNTSTTLDNLQTVNDTDYGGAGLQNLSLGTNRTLSRYLFLSYTIDDSKTATFPDATSSVSTITDFDLYYIPNPGNRLRSGNTFTNGASRGLDAQPQ